MNESSAEAVRVRASVNHSGHRPGQDDWLSVVRHLRGARAAGKKDREMKLICVGLSMICNIGLSTAFAQEPPDVNIFSFADTSCAEWTRSKGDEPSRAIYGAWFRGFVSGYNFGNSANQVPLNKLPDPAALALYIDNYCRESPKLPFIGAAIPLLQEIREFRNPAAAKKL